MYICHDMYRRQKSEHAPVFFAVFGPCHWLLQSRLHRSDSPCRQYGLTVVRWPSAADDRLRRSTIRDARLFGLRSWSGAVNCSKPIQCDRRFIGSPTSAGAATVPVSQPGVEDEVSGELDCLTEIEKDDDGPIYVEL